MNRWTVLLVTLLLGAMVAMGCSSGGGSPITPNADPAITGGTPHNGAGVQTHLWGYWDCHVNLETQEVEVVRNRTAEFSANVVTFLNGNPAGLMFDIIETPTEAEWVDVDINVSLTHPLPGLPQYDGYDVKGVFVADASASLDYDSALEYSVFGVDQFMFDDPDDDDGGGPDGYTRWYNQQEFTIPGVLGYTQGNFATPGYNCTATLNSYKYFADGLGPFDDLWTWLEANPDTSGVFSSGSTNTRNYYLRFPDLLVDYGYAVVASWIGEEEEDHPAPAPEAAGCRVLQTENAYWVDDTSNGGQLILDIDLWNWETSGQPSVIYVESDAIGGSVMLDSAQMDGMPNNGNFSTYYFDAACTNLVAEGNEYWVICEYPDYDYSNEFDVPNNAENDTLAAFFRYDMTLLEEAPCPIPDVVSIDPDDGMEGQIINATITVAADPVLEDGASLDAYLGMTGQTDIAGENVTFVDPETITADFDLTDAELGFWDVYVVNGCDSVPGVLVGAFEVTESTTGIYVIDDGDLPDPQPYPDDIHFSVVGPTTMGFNGVYYFGNNYQLLKYPLDYSADGSLYMTLSGYPGYSALTWFGSPNQVGKVEVDAAGGVICTSYGTSILFSAYLQNQCISWWAANTAASSNALVLNSLYGTVRSRDVESEFSAFGVLWGHYGVEADFGYAGNDVEIVMVGVGYPYGGTNYTTGWGIDWGPLDEVTGSLDGECSDIEAFRLAIDSDPHDNTPGFNFLHYYLEGASPDPSGAGSDDPTIEVFENIKSSLGSAASSYATIDETNFTGTPIDICVVNGYNILDGGTAASNWLAVLEDNGDSTWQVAIFEQDGTLVERLSTAQDGDAFGLDVDNASQEIHVWVDDAGTLRYFILGWP